jgi:formate dehydrogenase major subunit
VTGDVVNDLVAISEEPNVRIMESKALVCNIVSGRRAAGPEALEQLAANMEPA